MRSDAVISHTRNIAVTLDGVIIAMVNTDPSAQ